jgi:predicted N-acyltransferase
VTTSPTAARHGLTVEVHDDPRAAARAGWDDLVRGDGAPVFYHSAYLAAYHDDPLGDVARFGYLLARDDAGVPVGALPVGLHRDPDPLGQLPITGPALLSHVWHCYDTRIVGADRPDVVAALLATLSRLASDWGADCYGLINVARDTATAASVTAAGWTGRYLVDRFATDLTGVTALPDYLARLRATGRANLTRNRRRAADHAMITTVSAPAGADLPEIAALCEATAARFGTGRFYPPQMFARFVTALGPLAHVIQVRQGGRLVAVGVCLADATRFHTWTCGVDYAVTGNASPYAVLFCESLALALRLGRPVFEGGRANDTFKRRHGLTPRPLDAYLRRTP